MVDARAMGAGARQLEALRARIEREEGSEDALGVWPEHWHAFSVFRGMASGGQWRVVNLEGRVMYQGLDYAALSPVLEEHRRMPRRLRQSHRLLMPQLRTLAAAACAALNKAD